MFEMEEQSETNHENMLLHENFTTTKLKIKICILTNLYTLFKI